MMRPDELTSDQPHGPWSCSGSDIWDAFQAAATGDVSALRAVLVRDPNLYRAEYWYTQPIHFAVREGHVAAVQMLLDAGADPDGATLDGDDLITVARDRGHVAVARILETAVAARRRVQPEGGASLPRDAPDDLLHEAAAAGDLPRVRELLDREPHLVHRGDRKGSTPLHRAVAASAHEAIGLLLERGADVHARHGAGPGDGAGYAPVDSQPIDLALARGDEPGARLLLARGAEYDVAVAAALGDRDRVTALLDANPTRIRDTRPTGRRPLSYAAEFGHQPIVRLLLERGADPNWPEGAEAPRGMALHIAARRGDREMVELLLDHGADANADIDSSGSATFAARTRELRHLLIERGGTLDTYDLVWLGEDDEVVRRVSDDPRQANSGCGGVLAAACKLGKRDLVVRLLAAGARVPPTVTACRSYLLHDPDLLRLLLESGMDPNLPNWQLATPLHDLCGRDGRGRPRPHRIECAAILLDAGADISVKDEDYRSTPLGWAARHDLPDMVELLLVRHAPTNLPDDEPWATPLAWAMRRGHERVIAMLREAGAVV